MGWEVSFSLLRGGVGRRGHPLRGGWSHSPPVGKGGDVDGMACGRVGGSMLVGEAKAVEAMAFAARSTGVVMEATGAVVAVTES